MVSIFFSFMSLLVWIVVVICVCHSIMVEIHGFMEVVTVCHFSCFQLIVAIIILQRMRLRLFIGRPLHQCL